MKRLYMLGFSIVLALAGCQSKPPAAPRNELNTRQMDGVVLTYPPDIQPPGTFKAINQQYRALYPVSVISEPDYGGKRIKSLETGQSYLVLGAVENFWLAISDRDDGHLVGYVPLNSGVKSDLYEKTVAAESSRRPGNQCVRINGGSHACRKDSSATWIIQ